MLTLRARYIKCTGKFLAGYLHCGPTDPVFGVVMTHLIHTVVPPSVIGVITGYCVDMNLPQSFDTWQRIACSQRKIALTSDAASVVWRAHLLTTSGTRRLH